MTRHTPTPWYVKDDNDPYKIYAECNNIKVTVANCDYNSGDCRPNAEYIVEAVNNHERLKTENERLRDIVESYVISAQECGAYRPNPVDPGGELLGQMMDALKQTGDTNDEPIND